MDLIGSSVLSKVRLGSAMYNLLENGINDICSIAYPTQSRLYKQVQQICIRVIKTNNQS